MVGIRVATTVAFVLGLALCTVAAPAVAKAPPGRFQLQDAGKTVRDGLSGLVWQVTTDAAVTKTRQDAQAWCKNNSGGLPGSGWRLPTFAELRTLIDRGQVAPSLEPVAFASDVQQWSVLAAGTTWYWTTTLQVGAAGAAWYINFGYGDSGAYAVTNALRVRCVR